MLLQTFLGIETVVKTPYYPVFNGTQWVAGPGIAEMLEQTGTKNTALGAAMQIGAWWGAKASPRAAQQAAHS